MGLSSPFFFSNGLSPAQSKVELNIKHLGAVQPIWFEKSTNKKKTNEIQKGTNHNKKTKESKQIPKQNKKQKTNKKKQYFMKFHEIS
jgi:hypothetical protein